MTKSKYANRGKSLEDIIDKTNEEYKKLGIADVRKVPTPFKVLGRAGTLSKGFFMAGDWVDYVGISGGYTLVFDAKQTQQKSFPLSNLHEHQYELLESWHEHGAKSFLIVHFTTEDKYYYLPFEELKWAYDRMEQGGRKSIALKEFEERGIKIHKEAKILDYLRKV